MTATIGVGQEPLAIATDPRTPTTYSRNFDDGTVSVIDEATNTVTHTITIGGLPRGIAVDPAMHSVYVSNGGGIKVIDEASETVTDTIPVGNAPEGVAVDPATHTVYVANYGDDSPRPGRRSPGCRRPAARRPAGRPVTLTGTNFASASQVYFGSGTPAATFHVDSDTQITATSPAHSPGTVQVRVVRPGGISAITTADRYTYG